MTSGWSTPPGALIVCNSTRADGLKWSVSAWEGRDGLVEVQAHWSRAGRRAGACFTFDRNNPDPPAHLLFCQSDGFPAVVVGCCTPEVISLGARGQDRLVHRLELTELFPQLGLKFAVAPLPDGTGIVSYLFDTATVQNEVWAAFRIGRPPSDESPHWRPETPQGPGAE